jgi:hypothetical protein
MHEGCNQCVKGRSITGGCGNMILSRGTGDARLARNITNQYNQMSHSPCVWPCFPRQEAIQTSGECGV